MILRSYKVRSENTTWHPLGQKLLMNSFKLSAFLSTLNAIVQLIDFDWPANILAGSYFCTQETQALSPDSVCALPQARLGMRLC